MVFMNTKSKSKSNFNLGMKKIAKLTTAQRRENAKKAAVTARAKRTTKEIVQIMLDSTISDVQKRKEIESYGMAGIRRAELIDNIIKRASKSANMAELLFRLSGDLENDKQVNVTVVNQLSDKELENERQRLSEQTNRLIDVTPKPPIIDQ